MSEDHHAEKSIFLAAIEIASAAERAAFLDEACAGDLPLRGAVEALLEAHGQPQQLLDALSPLPRSPAEGERRREEGAAGAPKIREDHPPERPGTVIGPYKLLQVIGEGGMGTVFMAEQTRPVQRKVAVKIIKPGMGSGQVVDRFEAERQALALMDHPNIAKVFDAGTVLSPAPLGGEGRDEGDGRPYFVMELVKGVPITQYCDDHRLAPKERLGLFVPVCLAVQHAHQKGIIHRDLKPSNVLVALYDGEPVPKVIDFGVAKATGPKLTERTLYTEFGSIIGTLEYMSPEQAELNQLDVDTRSDVYSLGVLLYELLTGTTPLVRQRLKETSILEVLRIIREEELPKPSSRLSQARHKPAGGGQEKGDAPWALPPRFEELDWIVMKCLEKDRNRRYETAAGLAQDLGRYLADEPVLACPPSAAYRLRKLARRNKAAFLTALAVAASLVLAVVVLAVSTARIKAERDEKGTALGQAQRAEQAAQERLCDSLLVQARAGRSSRRPGQRLESLKALAQAARLSRALGRGPAALRELRNEAIDCLALPDVRLEKEWEGSPPGTNGLGFDARFERYAWSLKDEGIRICRVADQQELLRLRTLPAERVSRWLIPRFSPDGRFLAVWYSVWSNQRPLQIWELKPGVSQPLRTLADAATQPEFSPDGRTLAVGLPDNSLRLFDLTTGQETKRVPLGLLPERLAFHPDGQKLAVSSTQQPRVQVRDLASGQVVYTLPHPAGVQAVAWHPRGQLLATGCDDHFIYLWDGASGERRGVLEGHSWEVGDLAFNDSGEQLASFGWDMTLRLWDVATRKPLWHLENIRMFAFCREGPLRAAGLSGRQVRLWACVPSTEFHVFRGPTQSVGGGTFVSPDGRYLSASMRVENSMHPEVWFWDLRRKFAVARLADVHLCGWDAEGNPLFTTNKGQLVRRPVRERGESGGDQLVLGPAESLLDRPLGPGLHYGISCGRNCRLLEISSPPPNPLIQVFWMDGTARKLWERVIPNFMTSGSTADGRWWAAGTQDGGRGVSIFEARTGKPVKELVIGDAVPAFSPDGRWLVTTTGRLTSPEGECCLWRTDTWEAVRRQPLHCSSSSPAPVVVSPDGTMAAVAYSMSEVRLLHLETLEEIATLAAPEPGIIVGLQFAPDGRQLFATVGKTVHAWDLHALRRGLREIGLDWDTPVPTGGGS
jgi:serine/threonine protein kinase/WD40 repeat protein